MKLFFVFFLQFFGSVAKSASALLRCCYYCCHYVLFFMLLSCLFIQDWNETEHTVGGDVFTNFDKYNLFCFCTAWFCAKLALSPALAAMTTRRISESIAFSVLFQLIRGPFFFLCFSVSSHFVNFADVYRFVVVLIWREHDRVNKIQFIFFLLKLKT